MRELTTWNDGTEPAQAAAEETIVQSVEQTSPRPKSKRQSKSTDQPESEDQRQPDSHEFSFAELDLSETMQAAIDRLGFEAPTPIQFKAIPALATGRDFIGIAQTGTGKTAAFGIPLLQKLDFDSKVVQALVLAPTRELALQTAAGIKELGHGTGLKIAAVYGGAPIGRQISELKGGAQIVVGTPGRILDHLNRGSINLSQVETCILDEADEMLALGFAEDLETILGSLPSQRQMAFFSATMPARITALTHKYLDNPLRVTIESKQRTHELTTERYYEVERGQKLLALTRILAMEMPGPTIIFCRTKQDTADLTERLRGTGISAEAIHGDINQAERERVLRRFRDGLNTVLVATDVAARGLDISGVTHVVNFDIPGDPEQYIHRIGRTGRAGRNGDAITLISPRERGKLKMIQRITGAKIEQGFVPTEAEIHRFKRELFAETILAAATAAEESGTNAPTDFMQLAADLSEKLGALESLATVLQQLWTIQNPAAKGSGSRENGRSSSESGRSGRGYEGSPSGSFIKVRLSMGKMDGLRPGDIVGAIVKEAGVPSQHVGSIDLGDRFSVVELASETAEAIMETLRNTTLRNKEVHVRLWDEDGGSPSSGRSGAARGRRIHRGGAENRYSESPEYARGGDYSRSRVTTRNRG